jgi:hypothetical protein
MLGTGPISEMNDRNIQGMVDNLINMVNFLVNGGLEGGASCAGT